MWCRHAHMHTHNKPGIGVGLSMANFTWTPPFALLGSDDDELFGGLEELTLDNINKEFDKLWDGMGQMGTAEEMNQTRVANIHSFVELDAIDTSHGFRQRH